MNGSRLAFFACLTVTALGATAQTSKEHALMGRTSWSAFECAALSSVMGDTAEMQRLFQVGYDAGKNFLGAVQSDKVTRADIEQEIPSGLAMVMAGPTIDFMLGRAHESAVDNALKDVLTSNGRYNSDVELRKMLAESKYTRQNCRLLGSK